jgi:UDP-N-acetylmuramyl tripeptide synthase
MMNRVLSLSAAVALLLFVGMAVAADKSDKADDNTHSGLVASVADGKLTMTDQDGKNEHTHVVSKDAKITCNGKECKLEDLKKGSVIVVTTGKEGDSTVAVKIQATAPSDKDK